MSIEIRFGAYLKEATARQDKIFEYVYHKAEINRPHGGLMYIHPLLQSTEYTLPETVEEEH